MENGAVSFRDDLPSPETSETDARVRVLRAGICGTDLRLLAGYRPFAGVPGHEFVGVVEEGPADWAGARVVCEINVTCRSRGVGTPCAPCSEGRSNHCDLRDVIGISGRDGAFAESVSVPHRNLHRVPDELTDDQAVFVEPLAAAIAAARRVESSSPGRVVLLGPGRLGRLVAEALHGGGFDLVVAGRPGPSLDRAREAGFQTMLATALGPMGADVVVDCTGSPEGLSTALDAVRAGGHIVLKSTFATTASIDTSRVVVNEIRIEGSRCGDFEPAIAALAGGTIDVTELIEDRFALDRIADAFSAASQPGAGKVLLEI